VKLILGNENIVQVEFPSLSAIKPKFFQSSVGKNLNELKAVK